MECRCTRRRLLRRFLLGLLRGWRAGVLRLPAYRAGLGGPEGLGRRAIRAGRDVLGVAFSTTVRCTECQWRVAVGADPVTLRYVNKLMKQKPLSRIVIRGIRASSECNVIADRVRTR